MSAEIILETENLTKEFAGFIAVNGVNLWWSAAPSMR